MHMFDHSLESTHDPQRQDLRQQGSEAVSGKDEAVQAGLFGLRQLLHTVRDWRRRRVERSTSSRRPHEEELTMNIVKIRTQDFQGEALHIGELPALKVMSTLGEKDDMRRLVLFIETLKTALLDQGQVAKIDALSMDQLLAVVKAYIEAKPFQKDVSEF
jgi:hypothetical protein